jgi:5-methylcytosine-specific restriction endonuclease McrA
LDRDKQYRDTDAYRAKHAADERIRRNRNPEAFKAYRRDYYARELKSTRVLMTPEERRNSLLESLKRHWRNNREQYRTRTRNYLARKRGAYGTHSDEDIEFMLAYQQFLCFWCGHDISDGKHHVDHLIPLSKGGSNGPDNLVGACSSCNKSKGAKLPDEFLFLSNKKQVSP